MIGSSSVLKTMKKAWGTSCKEKTFKILKRKIKGCSKKYGNKENLTESPFYTSKSLPQNSSNFKRKLRGSVKLITHIGGSVRFSLFPYFLLQP